MRAMTAELGQIKFTSLHSNLALTLSSTCSILLPDDSDRCTSAEEISHLVKSGQLWVARAGTCLLEAEAVVSGLRVSTRSGSVSVEGFEEAIASCPIWTQLGLKLTRDIRPGLPSSCYAFSIDHAASTCLVNPAPVPHAGFGGISCGFDFEVIESQESNSRRSRRVRSQEKKKTRQRKGRVPGQESGNIREVFRNLTLRPVASALLEAALRALVGVPRRVLGVRQVQAPTSPLLIEIAPAVWNSHYLQTIAARSVFLPSIAQAILGLSSAQSPSLRQKALSLIHVSQEVGDQLVTPNAPSSQMSETSNSLGPTGPERERQIWVLLLTGVSLLTGTARPGRKGGSKVTVSQHEPYNGILTQESVSAHEGSSQGGITGYDYLDLDYDDDAYGRYDEPLFPDETAQPLWDQSPSTLATLPSSREFMETNGYFEESFNHNFPPETPFPVEDGPYQFPGGNVDEEQLGWGNFACQEEDGYRVRAYPPLSNHR